MAVKESGQFLSMDNGMGGSKRDPISRVDLAWLRMEQPTNLMMITGVIILDRPVEFGVFKKLVTSRFLSFRRFRQKTVDTPRGSWWETDALFDERSHVVRTALPGRADKQALEALVSSLASTPLDKTKPLWQFHFVENYLHGPAVIARIHHCYADGIALIQVLLSLTETDRQKSLEANSSRRWKEKQVAGSGVFRRLAAPAHSGLRVLQETGAKALECGADVLRDPRAAGASVAELMGELGQALLLPDDSRSPFRGRLGVRKNIAWAEPIILDEVKAVSRILGCSVNDILIAVMTGALHRYVVECGASPGQASMRATVPVNLRPLDHAPELGNHFGLVFLDLPIAQKNPLRRVYQVSDNMRKLKESRQAAITLGALAALGMGPAALQKPALEMFSRKASAVLTNVPGPQKPLYLAGARLREMMFWVPQTGSMGMGISILSYNGKVFSGLVADHNLVPDPQNVVLNFRTEFENLLHWVMLLGADDAPLPADEAEYLVARLCADCD